MEKPKASELIQGTLLVLILKLLAMNDSMTISGMREMTEKITLEKFQIEEADILNALDGLKNDNVVIATEDRYSLTEEGKLFAKKTIENFSQFLDQSR